MKHIKHFTNFTNESINDNVVVVWPKMIDDIVLNTEYDRKELSKMDFDEVKEIWDTL